MEKTVGMNGEAGQGADPGRCLAENQVDQGALARLGGTQHHQLWGVSG